ncbi:hypothetical protein BLOT_013410, partial [Blomia tropicalis]
MQSSSYCNTPLIVYSNPIDSDCRQPKTELGSLTCFIYALSTLSLGFWRLKSDLNHSIHSRIFLLELLIQMPTRVKHWSTLIKPKTGFIIFQ